MAGNLSEFMQFLLALVFLEGSLTGLGMKIQNMNKYLFVLCALLIPHATYAATADDEVKSTVTKIYKLGSQFEELVAREKEDEVVRGRLKTIIKGIATGDFLNRWMEFIDQTSTSSSFYRTVFESMTPTNSLKILSTDINNASAVATAKLEVTELYAPSVDMVSLDELFAKYKITNLKVIDVVNMLPTTPLAELVEYKINSSREDMLHLKNIDGKWKIEKIDQKIMSSTMDVILPKASK